MSKEKAGALQDHIEAIIHKATVHDLTIHVGQSGLCLGDRVVLCQDRDGQIGVFCKIRRRILIFTRLAEQRIGHLGTEAGAIVAPALDEGEPLRVRIVGLTPEHLARDGRAEVHVSVWGSTRRFTERQAFSDHDDPSELSQTRAADEIPTDRPAG